MPSGPIQDSCRRWVAATNRGHDQLRFLQFLPAPDRVRVRRPGWRAATTPGGASRGAAAKAPKTPELRGVRRSRVAFEVRALRPTQGMLVEGHAGERALVVVEGE